MTRRIVPGLVALALALPVPALAQAAAPDLRAEIAKIDQAWEKAYNAGDAAALAALYTSAATLMAPGAEPASGTKAIQALYKTELAQGSKLALKQGDVVGFGDYAFETGSW